MKKTTHVLVKFTIGETPVISIRDPECAEELISKDFKRKINGLWVKFSIKDENTVEVKLYLPDRVVTKLVQGDGFWNTTKYLEI